MTNMKMKTENMVTLDHCYNIEKRFSNYANMEIVKEIRKDMEDLATTEELAIMTEQYEEMKKLNYDRIILIPL